MSLKHFSTALALVLLATAANGATLFLQPGSEGKDAQVASSLPTTNFGNDPDLTTNYGGPDHGLVEFDLSSIPPGAVITSAVLGITEYENCLTRWQMEVSINTAAWVESTVTWDTQPGYSSGIGTPFNETDQCDTLQTDVTAQVQAWIDGDPNYGFRVSGPGGTDITKYTYSGDYSTPGVRPYLDIEYTAPVPSVSSVGLLILALVLAAAGWLALRRHRVATAAG